MNITVYLASSYGNIPEFKDEIRRLGTWIGSNGHTLIYGGSKSGLMGELAESVLEAGGSVVGVEPRFFVDAGLVYDRISELVVTETMAERKAEMIARGDAFIAFPGGTGTLEEIAEIMSRVSLRGTPAYLDAPCIIYNVGGFYDALKVLLEHMVDTGLSSVDRVKNIRFASNIDEIRQILEQ